MIKIDKGVARPTKEGGGAKPKYPYAKMEIGDSFLHPLKNPNTSGAAERTGFRFSARREGKGARIWRIA